MPDQIRWGIMGTGGIAELFVEGLSILPDVAVVAVGSRQQASAESFGQRYGIPNRYGSYDEVAADPNVDAVYVSTIHPWHYANTKACLEAGKAVLCEKPFTINASQLAELIALAREKQVFMMEAMWTRFMPAIGHVQRLLESGVLGEIRMVMADFGFRTAFNPDHRLLNLEMGGGALLDVGIYPVSFASMVFRQQPKFISSQANIGQTGVDEQCGMVFKYGAGELAILSAAVRTDTPSEAIIIGTEGRLTVHYPFWNAQALTLQKGVHQQKWHFPQVGNGYNYEAAHVGECLRAGKLESEVISLDESLAIMQTLDTIRGQWGLKYPQES